MNQTARQENPPQSFSSVFNVIIFTALVLIGGVGIFYAGYQYGLNKSTQDTNMVKEVPYGDETIGEDPNYREAMETDPETGNFVSYNGYSLSLPTGWRKLASASTETTEIFSSLSDSEIQNIMNEDPYNPSYYLEVDVRDNPNGVTLDEWATNSNYSPQGLGQSVSSVMIGPYQTVKVTDNQGDGFVDYYISKDGKVYNLGYFYNPTDQWQSPSGYVPELFENIIASFTVAN